MFPKLWLKILFFFVFFSKISFCYENYENIKAIENYLNSIETITSDFIQTNEDGRVLAGKFFLKKPGKMFFEYNKPSNIVIISNNNVITIINKVFPKSYQKYPLSLTPLYNLTKKKINLIEDKILKNDISFSETNLNIIFFDYKNPKNGELKLVFSMDPIQLNGWKYTSFSKEKIEINLKNFKKNIFIPDDKFDYELYISNLKN